MNKKIISMSIEERRKLLFKEYLKATTDEEQNRINDEWVALGKEQRRKRL